MFFCVVVKAFLFGAFGGLGGLMDQGLYGYTLEFVYRVHLGSGVSGHLFLASDLDISYHFIFWMIVCSST